MIDKYTKSSGTSKSFSLNSIEDEKNALCGLPAKVKTNEPSNIASFNSASWRSTVRYQYEYDVFLVYDESYDYYNAEVRRLYLTVYVV